MKKYFPLARSLQIICTFGFAIWSATGIAVAADDIKNKLNAAQSSPLFQQKFSSSEISARKLDRVVMHNGVELNFKKYTTLTRLDTNEQFQPLMNPQTFSRYLQSKPSYSEEIIQLEDRLIVARTLDVKIKAGTCKEQSLPDAVNELCFTAKEGGIPVETREYLADMREKFQIARPEVVVMKGKTAQQMLALSDAQLLELLLNSGNRKIRLVSVLPTRVYSEQTSLNLWNTNTRLKASNFKKATTKELSLENKQYMAIPKVLKNENKPRNQEFATEYFLTGYTVGREIQDEFEIEFAEESFWHDRYYARFSYEFSVGFGLRFPFSVSVASKATDGIYDNVGGAVIVGEQVMANPDATPAKPTKPNQGMVKMVRAYRLEGKKVEANPGKTPAKPKSFKDRIFKRPVVRGGGVACDASKSCETSGSGQVKSAEITMSVAPVNVNSNGEPAYSAVNLPQDKYFGGKEFVLEFSAGCKFKASIPGPDINVSCPTIKRDYSRQINPIIGNDRSRLGELWIDGAALGLGINVWVGQASIDFGIQANITDGRIGVVAKGFNGTKIRGTQSSNFKLNSTSPISFNVENPTGGAAFELTNPTYAFDLELLPVARMKLNLDLGVYELKKTLGPYGIDVLSLTLASFTLPRHEGTVNSHIYIP